MDTGSEERERGVTVDIAQHHFKTKDVDFTILDAPGHRDFVPNMIGGAFMADLAVLVVDANQLESGMKGQTSEHILLAKAVGLERIVVAVNKMDLTVPPWNQDDFEKVEAKVSHRLEEAGFAKEHILVVPCSGLGGQNVIKAPSAAGELAWISRDHSTLIQALEKSLPNPTPAEDVEKPLRMQIADVFRGGITNPLSVSGRIISGNVQVGVSAAVQPSGERAQIRGIEVNGESKSWAVAGQLCTLHLAEIEVQHLRAGDMLCDADQPLSTVKEFTLHVSTIESILPQGVDVHMGRLHVPGNIVQLISILDETGNVIRKKPRIVQAKQQAVIKINVDHGMPVEVGQQLVLRANGSTIAAGAVKAIVT
jgi:elongation factor 1 alpha-like protein